MHVLLVLLDLLILGAIALAAAVATAGGVDLVMGPLALSSHDMLRPSAALALLLVLRWGLARRPVAQGLLGPLIGAVARRRGLRRTLVAAATVLVLAGAGWGSLRWYQDREDARGRAHAAVDQSLGRGAATIARVTRPIPETLSADDDARRAWMLRLDAATSPAFLRAHYGLMEPAARFAGGSVLFRVSARLPGEANWRRLWEARLAASDADDPPGWREAGVDLGPLAGRPAELLLEATPGGRRRDAVPFAFWARPAVGGDAAAGPSIVLVSLDTLRADRLGCYGYRERPTSPELDAIAAAGTRFEQVIAPSPWTTPSHMSLLTGQYPTVHAVDAPIESAQRRLAGAKVTLAEALHARGYRTAAFTGSGAISAVYGFWQGFDVYDETPRGATGREGEDLPVIYERAVRWLEENRERPFFLFLHTYEIHNPYTHDRFLGDRDLPEGEERRSRLYDGGIAFADAYLGRLVADLERLGLVGHTVLMILSDHGEDLAGRYPDDRWYYHGHNLYEELLRVPLVVAGADVARGRVVGEQVSLIDVMPTLLELTGTPLPEGHPVQGVSLAPHLDPKRDITPGEGPGHAYAFAEAVNRGPERKAVRTPERKLVWIPSLDQTGRSPIEAALPRRELLDLVRDPGETRNLADSEPEITRHLMDRLEAWLARNRVLRRQVEEVSATVDEATFESLRGLGYVQ